MASVDRNVSNSVAKTTSILASPPGNALFDTEIVFAADAIPVFAFQFPIFNQQLDASYGRALNTGRGVVGEGGNAGPGVVGIAGGVIANPNQPMPRPLADGPHLGRGILAGVIGFGADPAMRGERGAQGDAVGVFGHAAKSVGVFGLSDAQPGVFGFATHHAGVFGFGAPTGVIGDGSGGHIGVEGISGASYGVYGHVNFKNPSNSMIGVFGAASFDLGTSTVVGKAGVFVGPVEVHGDLVVTGTVTVATPGKAAAAKHDDGTRRLLYCMESPESQFEDFGEAELVKGRAKVRLDRDFIGVADTRHYYVFLTAYGDSNGLYVAERTKEGFLVREQGGGTGRLKFAYRVVAKRKHHKVERFRKVKLPVAPKIPKPLARPDVDVTPRKAKPRRG
jgi:hypothetical protein